MKEYFNSTYPSVEHLREQARKRLPKFAFEYLDSGCYSEINLFKNTSDIRNIELQPYYLQGFKGANIKTRLFGEEYDAPFGMAPVGLQGLMWPQACEILAKATVEHNLPFVLSTVSTASIEKIAKITDGRFWFQLYHPVEEEVKKNLLDRAWNAGARTLVILADVPTFAYRPKEIKNGLSIPPRLTLDNIWQIFTHPTWSLSQLMNGIPKFQTVDKYIPKGLDIKHLGMFMDKMFNGRLTNEKVSLIRDYWKGNLVIKGTVTSEDIESSIKLGLDGVIISNHGGRQLDNGPSTITSLREIKSYKDKIKLMIDSGIRSGPDVANMLASGADFTFLGRAPMYAVSALGKNGGDHIFTMFKRQFTQVMEQLACERIEDLPNFIVKK